MKKKNPLIVGTLILTLTGLISRMIGFFYRIFLSQLFGEEGMGIYQLISPVLALSFSLTAAGIQTSISKMVASETTDHNYRSSLRTLLTGLCLSMSLSAGVTFYVYQYADWLAAAALQEPRCAPLIRILALSIPFTAIHSIANGYFYGIKSTSIPALTQLAEQISRVAGVYLISRAAILSGRTPTISVAVVGMVIGDMTATCISLAALYGRFSKLLFLSQRFTQARQGRKMLHDMLVLSIPLSANRITVNLLQSIEAVYIPSRLRLFGLDVKGSLSIYGVLTGMALPLILFPSAITNSVSVLLLPLVSEAQSSHNQQAIRRAVHKSVKYCLLLGVAATLGFLFLGGFMGEYLFHSTIAGSFIRTLSFICPLLYISSTLSSVLNGLGKTHLTFCFNVSGLAIRLLFVFMAIPVFGIKGYMWGLLCSQFVITLLTLCAVEDYIRKHA